MISKNYKRSKILYLQNTYHTYLWVESWIIRSPNSIQKYDNEKIICGTELIFIEYVDEC